MIDPQFTESWLDSKLAEIFDAAVAALRVSEDEGDAVTWAFARTLHIFHYEGMTVREIQDAIWETHWSDVPVALYDQDCDV
jgi:hypothetical protein